MSTSYLKSFFVIVYSFFILQCGSQGGGSGSGSAAPSQTTSSGTSTTSTTPQPLSVNLSGPSTLTVGTPETYTLSISGNYTPDLNISWDSDSSDPNITLPKMTFNPNPQVINQTGVQQITVQITASQPGTYNIIAPVGDHSQPAQQTFHEIQGVSASADTDGDGMADGVDTE